MSQERDAWEKSQREEFTKLLAGMPDINFRFDEINTDGSGFGSWHFEFQYKQNHFRVAWDGKENRLLGEQRENIKPDAWVERGARQYEISSPEVSAVWMACKKMLTQVTREV